MSDPLYSMRFTARVRDLNRRDMAAFSGMCGQFAAKMRRRFPWGLEWNGRRIFARLETLRAKAPKLPRRPA